jgi:threonine dehydrogenase-like Zn-dependent dehydrogenase
MMKAAVYKEPYRGGQADVQEGKILGPENMGIVEETGTEVILRPAA